MLTSSTANHQQTLAALLQEKTIGFLFATATSNLGPDFPG
jgi:hypothetical protein